MDHLPFILLAVRTAIHEDSSCSLAELVFGESLCLPADLLDPDPLPSQSPSDFVVGLRGQMQQNIPMPFNYHSRPVERVPAALSSCTHAFVRVDAVRHPLVPPYEGPFKVLERGVKSFLLERNGKHMWPLLLIA